MVSVCMRACVHACNMLNFKFCLDFFQTKFFSLYDGEFLIYAYNYYYYYYYYLNPGLAFGNGK